MPYDPETITMMQLAIDKAERKAIAASQSCFEVECPTCGHMNDFVDDRHRDDLLDDGSTSEVDCEWCKDTMEIQTHATYRLEVVK